MPQGDAAGVKLGTVADLADELDEAERWEDAARAGRAREELELLTQAFAEAVGLGGRHRKAAAVSERARISVTKAIRAAGQRIGEKDSVRTTPSLGHTLAGAVRTGSFCSYAPPPDAPCCGSCDPARPSTRRAGLATTEGVNGQRFNPGRRARARS